LANDELQKRLFADSPSCRQAEIGILISEIDRYYRSEKHSQNCSEYEADGARTRRALADARERWQPVCIELEAAIGPRRSDLETRYHYKKYTVKTKIERIEAIMRELQIRTKGMYKSIQQDQLYSDGHERLKEQQGVFSDETFNRERERIQGLAEEQRKIEQDIESATGDLIRATRETREEIDRVERQINDLKV